MASDDLHARLVAEVTSPDDGLKATVARLMAEKANLHTLVRDQAARIRELERQRDLAASLGIEVPDA